MPDDGVPLRDHFSQRLVETIGQLLGQVANLLSVLHGVTLMANIFASAALEVAVVAFSSIMGYIALFVLFQVGKLRTELLLEIKDLEARLVQRITER